MRMIQGTTSLNLASADQTTVDIELPEFDKNLYEIKALNFTVVPPASGAGNNFSTTIICLASIAINQRSSVTYADIYAKDMIARNGKVITNMLSASDTVGAYGITGYFDELNLVDPIAPYFNDDVRLIIQNLNTSINAGSYDIAWQIMYDVVRKTNNILDEMNQRRYTNTGGGG